MVTDESNVFVLNILQSLCTERFRIVKNVQYNHDTRFSLQCLIEYQNALYNTRNVIKRHTVLLTKFPNVSWSTDNTFIKGIDKNARYFGEPLHIIDLLKRKAPKDLSKSSSFHRFSNRIFNYSSTWLAQDPLPRAPNEGVIFIEDSISIISIQNSFPRKHVPRRPIFILRN